MNETTQNFFEAFKLIDLPKSIEFEYRLYYDQEGRIIRGTTSPNENHEEPYIVVDLDTFENQRMYYVRKGKLEKRRTPRVPELSTQGYRVVKSQSLLLLDVNEKIEDQYYEW
jgi:hypothetical protein